MYTNAAYLHDSFSDFMDLSKPLIVTCCGYYRIHTMPTFLTERPEGRRDYQLLYIASGKAHFFFHGKEHIITEGTIDEQIMRALTAKNFSQAALIDAVKAEVRKNGK